VDRSETDGVALPSPGRADAVMIRLAETTVALARLRADPVRFSRQFEQARTIIGYGQCLCRTPALRLVIRRTRTGRFHLATWPGSGAQHAETCDFYKPLDEQWTGRGAYTAGAMVEDGEGTRIRLQAALQVRQEPGGGLDVPSEQAAGAGQRGVGLLGLLHWLWEQGALNSWHRGAVRTWAHCHGRLTQAARSCLANGQPLAQALYVMPPWRREEAAALARGFELFRERLSERDGSRYRGLVLAEVAAIAPSRFGHRIQLRHQRLPLYCSAALMDRLQRSYRAVFGRARPVTSRQVGLFLVEKTPAGNLVLMDAALMLVNRAYLPADSSYEVEMADALLDARRSVVKPLRFDASRDLVLPDFVLVDTDPATVVEVYGLVGNAAYQVRRAAKEAHYRTTGTPLITWDVTASMPQVGELSRR